MLPSTARRFRKRQRAETHGAISVVVVVVVVISTTAASANCLQWAINASAFHAGERPESCGWIFRRGLSCAFLAVFLFTFIIFDAIDLSFRR